MAYMVMAADGQTTPMPTLTTTLHAASTVVTNATLSRITNTPTSHQTVPPSAPNPETESTMATTQTVAVESNAPIPLIVASTNSWK